MVTIVLIYNTNNVPDTMLGDVISFANHHDLNKNVLRRVHNFRCDCTFTDSVM